MFDYEPGTRVTANYKKTSKTTRTKYATTFCNAAKAAGYTSGVYCSTSWFPAYFNISCLLYTSCHLGSFSPLHYGHCIRSQRSRKRKEYSVCPQWEPSDGAYNQPAAPCPHLSNCPVSQTKA